MANEIQIAPRVSIRKTMVICKYDDGKTFRYQLKDRWTRESYPSLKEWFRAGFCMCSKLWQIEKVLNENRIKGKFINN